MSLIANPSDGESHLAESSDCIAHACLPFVEPVGSGAGQRKAEATAAPEPRGEPLAIGTRPEAAIYLDRRGGGKKVCPNVHVLAVALRSTSTGRTRRWNNAVCIPGCSRLPAAATRAEGPVVKNSVGSGLLAGEAGGIEAGRTRPTWIAGRRFPADRHTQQKTLGNSRTRSRSKQCGFPQKQASVAAPYPVPICNFQFPPCVQRADNRGLLCGKVQRFRPP